MAKVQIGSVSTGTLRTEDLLEAFAAELDRLRNTSQVHYRLVFDSQNRYYLDDGRDEREEEAAELVNELIDALQEYAPPFVYFGTLEGDGADFGFWVDRDAIEEALREAKYDDDDDDGYTYLEDYGLWLHVNDHGNVTLLTNVDGAPREVIWAVV
jgi:hypothetical protein